MRSALLFLVFNRPDTTRQVFEAIRKAQPPRLYIAADGPRPDKAGEREKCEEVRRIATAVDWDCEVKTLFREKNLGCKMGVSGGIDWFFEHEEMGVILEDDCLPSRSFFAFCDDLLLRYRDDQRIMHISGMTFVDHDSNDYSYDFVRVGGIWGWATWRRAWACYEADMDSYPDALECGVFRDIFAGDKKIMRYFLDKWRSVYGVATNWTWDYQWAYTKIINNSINIMPSKNLVINIGHGLANATHTTKERPLYANMRLGELSFPLIHPRFVVINHGFDYQNFLIEGKWKKGAREYLVGLIKRFPWFTRAVERIRKGRRLYNSGSEP